MIDGPDSRQDASYATRMQEGKQVKDLPSEEANLGSEKDSSISEDNYLQSWPLYVVTATLSLAVFLVILEISIVATSLVSISDSIGGYDQNSWVVTAYLLTYTSFLIIWAKLSDIFGRKSLCIISTCWFVAFSAACGAAQTMTQLIVFRAIQGIGGAGIYSIVMAMFFELGPPQTFATYTSLISAAWTLSLVAGPLLGGVINMYTMWRWVFLLNIPGGAACVIALLITLPNNFPNHGQKTPIHFNLRASLSRKRSQLGRVDYLGVILILAATVLSITALEEAGKKYSWDSPFIIVICICAGLAWMLFFFWSWLITSDTAHREPVFPWRFMQSRRRFGLLLTIFLTGGPFYVAVIQIPQRLQTVSGLSPLEAAIKMLPYMVMNPLGSISAPFIAKRFKVPPLYIVLTGSVIQLIGTVFLSTLSASSEITVKFYASEAVLGLGVGSTMASLILMTPFCVEERDKAVAVGAMVQFRTLGGTLGIATVVAIMNSNVKSRLAALSFSPEQIDALLSAANAFDSLSPAMAATARGLFAESYNLQMRVMIGFCAAQTLAALLLWQRRQVRV